MGRKQALVPIQLEAEAKEALAEWCRRRDVVQATALQRLIRWFVAQDEAIQASVLDLVSAPLLAALATMRLKRPPNPATPAKRAKRAKRAKPVPGGNGATRGRRPRNSRRHG